MWAGECATGCATAEEECYGTPLVLRTFESADGLCTPAKPYQTLELGPLPRLVSTSQIISMSWWCPSSFVVSFGKMGSAGLSLRRVDTRMGTLLWTLLAPRSRKADVAAAVCGNGV
jgi:hypothetical protein